MARTRAKVGGNFPKPPALDERRPSGPLDAFSSDGSQVSPPSAEATERLRLAQQKLSAAEDWQTRNPGEWFTEAAVKDAQRELHDAELALQPPAAPVQAEYWDPEATKATLRAELLNSDGQLKLEWKERLSCPATVELLLLRGEGHGIAAVDNLIKGHGERDSDLRELTRKAVGVLSPGYDAGRWRIPPMSVAEVSLDELPRWTRLDASAIERCKETDLFPKLLSAARTRKRSLEDRARAEFVFLYAEPGDATELKAVDESLREADAFLQAVPSRLNTLEREEQSKQAWLAWLGSQGRDDGAIVKEAHASTAGPNGNWLIASQQEFLHVFEGNLRSHPAATGKIYAPTLVNESDPRGRFAAHLANLATAEENAAGLTEGVGHNFLKEFRARGISFRIQDANGRKGYNVFYDAVQKRVCIVDPALKDYTHPPIPNGASVMKDLDSRESLTALLKVIREALSSTSVG